MKDKLKMKFNVLAVFCILIFCFALTPITFQNDTYYTIKIGEQMGLACLFPLFVQCAHRGNRHARPIFMA